MKIGAIIQARCGSSRLPGKVLMKLPISGTNTVLDHIIKRCRLAKTLDVVIVATTHNEEDNYLADEYPSMIFRGSEEDVLDRYFQAAANAELDIIVRLTADNPCIDSEILDQVVKQHIARGNDYTKTTGLPMGTNLQVVTFDALKTAWEDSSERYDREHVLPYIARNQDRFRIEIVNKNVSEVLQNLRLTLDYPSDYAMMNVIFSHFGQLAFSLADLACFAESYPWISSINQNYQKRQFSSEKEELKLACEELEKWEMFKAASIIRMSLNTKS